MPSLPRPFHELARLCTRPLQLCRTVPPLACTTRSNAPLSNCFRLCLCAPPVRRMVVAVVTAHTAVNEHFIRKSIRPSMANSIALESHPILGNANNRKLQWHDCTLDHHFQIDHYRFRCSRIAIPQCQLDSSIVIQRL